MADDRVYRFQLQYTPETEHFVARAPEIDVEVEAATRGEALEALESAVETEVERRAVEGENLPRPADLATESGSIELELAAPVYRDLLTHAAAQELEPEALALQLLTRALGHLEGRAQRRRPRQEAPKEDAAQADSAAPKDPPARKKKSRNRNRRREGYRPDMDDQANFLAYVRDQERGGRR